MAEIVYSNTVINPWAMAIEKLAGRSIGNSSRHILIMFGDAASTAPTVPTPEWLSCHTGDAEILFVELPLLKQFLNNLSLLIPAADFWNITRVLDHGKNVEISSQAEEDREQDVQNRR